MNLSDQLRALPNMSQFVAFSGLPRRTLDRIKAGIAKPNLTTQLAVQGQLEKFAKSRKAKK